MLLVQQQHLFAQQLQPFFINYSTEDGLPSSEVYCSFQDTLDYMWFGTDNGIARFDGYDFEVFDNDDGLEDVVVFSIQEDAEGVIWASTYSGQLFSWDGAQFQAFEHNLRLEAWKAEYSILKLVDADFRDGFLFSIKWKGYLYVSRQGDFELVVDIADKGVCLYSKEGKGEYGDVNAVYNCTINFNRFNNQSTEPLLDYKVTTDSWQNMGDLSSIGSNFRRYFKFHNANEYLSFNQQILNYYSGNNLVGSFHLEVSDINYIAQFRDKGIFLCLNDGDGLKYLEGWREGEEFLNIDFLEGNSISTINFDREGGMWVASLDKGVFYASSLESAVYRQSNEEANGKPISIEAIDSESVIVFFRDKTAQYFNSGIKKWEFSDTNGAAAFEVYYDAGHEELYTGGFNLLLGSDTSYQRIRPLSNHESLRAIDMRIKYFQYDNRKGEDKLFFGSDAYFGCYNLLSKEVDEFYHLSNAGQGLLTTRSYLIDNEGRHWLGTLHGLYEYFPDQQEVIAENLGIEALNQRVQEIRLLDDGALIFGTRGNGLVYYNSDTSFAITTQENLASDMIRDLHVDQDGAIWVATLTGLSKIQFLNESTASPHAYTLRTFGTAHGLPNEEIYDIDSFEESIWLATSSGVVEFSEPPVETYSRSPSFSKVLINDKEINIDNLKDMPAGDYYLNLKFNTINFRQLGKINYRYRLQADGEWTTTSQTEVSFPNLQAGEYQFEVQSQNADGFWSSSLLLPILIKFPWYKRWWAITLFVVAGIGIIYYLYKNRVYRLKRDQQVLRQIHQLERSALQAQMNPHFVFNSLTSIQNFILAQDTDAAVDYLAQFARLIRNTLNVSMLGEHSLEQEINMLIDYFELEKLRFREGFNYTIEVTEKISPENIFLPPLLIQPFVENAVKHGLEQDLQGGQVWLEFSGNADQLVVKISDNGRGFDLRKSRKDSSLGMHITQRRLELMQKYPTNLPPMSIALRYDEGGQVMGTEVTISIQAATHKSLSEK